MLTWAGNRTRSWFSRMGGTAAEHVASRDNDLHLVDDTPRTDIRLGLIVGGLFFVVFGGWAACAPLNAAVHATGSVVVAESRRTVQTQDGGTIDAIHVREGELVKAGEVLVEMRDGEARAERDALEAQWIELTALRARILAEEIGQPNVVPPPEWATRLNHPARARAEAVLQRQQSELEARRRFVRTQRGIIGSRRSQLSVQVGGLDAQRNALERQRALIADELAAARQLNERGFMPLPRVRALERSMAQIDGEIAGIQGDKARAREAMGETAMQSLSVDDQERVRRSEDLRRTDQLLAETTPRLEAATARLERALIRATTTGTVVGATGTTPGMVAPAGGRLMEIVPTDDELVIDAQIAPHDADDVAVGMAAEVRFPGLNGRVMPILSGTVENISADRFVDQRTGVGYFTVRVRVSDESLVALATNHPKGLNALGPGLPAEALIKLRERTALQYLLEPLDQTIWRSFREP